MTFESPTTEELSGDVRWEVTVGSSRWIKRVDFRVDGRLKWTDRTEPFVFNGDDGILNTRTMSNGQHTLTATAYRRKGVAGTKKMTVTVSNPDDPGTVVITSAPLPSPPPPPPATKPVAIGAPTISGTPTVGQTLTSTLGTWTGTAQISYTRRWERCTSNSCVEIDGVTAASYALASTDAGLKIRLTVTATNVAGSTSASSSSLTIQAPPPPPPPPPPSPPPSPPLPPSPLPPATSGPYGVALNADGLANLEIGKYAGRKISLRFRAEYSGQANSVRVYLIYRAAGYYAGTGGRVKVELQTDDGSAAHVPSGTVLASKTVTDPITTPSNSMRLFTFDSPASLIAGNLYHLVFTNPDSNPVANYVSLNDLYLAAASSPMQPYVSDTDLAVVWKPDGGSAWTVNRGHTPIFNLYYADGKRQGQCYLDARSSSGLLSIGGNTKAREVFTAVSARTVTSVKVRTRRGGSASNLNIELSQGGTVLATATLPAASVPTAYAWVSASLSSAVSLQAGATYELRLQATTGTYNVYPYQKGTSYGFTGGNLFTGYYQFTNDGSNWQSYSGSTQFDIPVYLT